jgi:hypothetical protein
LRRSAPRSGSIETITLVPQDASAPGTTNGCRSNIASGTAGSGTSSFRIEVPGCRAERWKRQRLDVHPANVPQAVQKCLANATGAYRLFMGLQGHMNDGRRGKISCRRDHRPTDRKVTHLLDAFEQTLARGRPNFPPDSRQRLQARTDRADTIVRCMRSSSGSRNTFRQVKDAGPAALEHVFLFPRPNWPTGGGWSKLDGTGASFSDP